MGRKTKEIQAVIREVMHNNVIDLSLQERKGKADQLWQGNKLFLCVEIKSTRPDICHIYDLDHPVRIGRDSEKNQICIQELCVSRKHGVIWQQDGMVWLANISGTNRMGIRRGLHKLWLDAGQGERIYSRDVILVGNMRIRIRIFMGENEVL